MTHKLLFLAAPLVLAACTAAETSPEPNAEPSGSVTEAPMTTPSPGPAASPTGDDARKATPTADTADELDSCGAFKVRARWTGALPTDQVKAEIAEAVGRRPIRYYTEGDPITMDYSEDRLNVVLGEDGRIAAFRCG